MTGVHEELAPGIRGKSGDGSAVQFSWAMLESLDPAPDWVLLVHWIICISQVD
jgi:hypothetical protein